MARKPIARRSFVAAAKGKATIGSAGSPSGARRGRKPNVGHYKKSTAVTKHFFKVFPQDPTDSMVIPIEFEASGGAIPRKVKLEETGGQCGFEIQLRKERESLVFELG